jgi:uncharacterized alkaline shock family protein YloU
MTEIKNTNGVGRIKISDEVIAIVAGTATLEVKGVHGMSGDLNSTLAVMRGHKNLSKGVKVSVNGDTVNVDINVLVKFGYKINDICILIQEKVKNAIETMTGLNVGTINIYVTSIHYDKEFKPQGTEDLI